MLLCGTKFVSLILAGDKEMMLEKHQLEKQQLGSAWIKINDAIVEL